MFVYSGVNYILITSVTWWVSNKRQELLTIRDHLGSHPVVDGVLVMFCVICLVCLRTLFCVHNVTSVSVLSICDYPLGFLYRIFTTVSYLQCFRIGKHGLIHKVHICGKYHIVYLTIP